MARPVGEAPIKQPSTRTEDELFDLVDDGHQLAGTFRNGWVKAQPVERRRHWVEDAVRTLQALADELDARLPPEHPFSQMERVKRRNAKMRAESEKK